MERLATSERKKFKRELDVWLNRGAEANALLNEARVKTELAKEEERKAKEETERAKRELEALSPEIEKARALVEKIPINEETVLKLEKEITEKEGRIEELKLGLKNQIEANRLAEEQELKELREKKRKTIEQIELIEDDLRAKNLGKELQLKEIEELNKLISNNKSELEKIQLKIKEEESWRDGQFEKIKEGFSSVARADKDLRKNKSAFKLLIGSPNVKIN